MKIRCGFRRGTIECRGDGYLWDADHDGYDPNEFDNPFPECNTETFLIKYKDEAETTSYYGIEASSGTGVDIWESAVETARKLNSEANEIALKKIGAVSALNKDESVKVFKYDPETNNSILKEKK